MEFGAEVPITYVMGGLAREFAPPHDARIREWLDTADASGMPLDPRLWHEAPLQSSYPACMAVKAAAEQGHEAETRCLRALREGIFCFRRKLDNTEALVEEARRAGLDVARFRVDLGSHAIVEAFGADLELTRSVRPDGAGRPALPAARRGPLGHGRRPVPGVAGGRDRRRRRARRRPGPGRARRAVALRPHGHRGGGGGLRPGRPTRAGGAVAAGVGVGGQAGAGADRRALGARPRSRA